MVKGSRRASCLLSEPFTISNSDSKNHVRVSNCLILEQSYLLCRFPISKLAGSTLFITGASRGIGKAIALRAARDGANIVIAAKTATPHPKLPGTIYSAAKEGLMYIFMLALNH